MDNSLPAQLGRLAQLATAPPLGLSPPGRPRPPSSPHRSPLPMFDRPRARARASPPNHLAVDEGGDKNAPSTPRILPLTYRHTPTHPCAPSPPPHSDPLPPRAAASPLRHGRATVKPAATVARPLLRQVRELRRGRPLLPLHWIGIGSTTVVAFFIFLIYGHRTTTPSIRSGELSPEHALHICRSAVSSSPSPLTPCSSPRS